MNAQRINESIAKGNEYIELYINCRDEVNVLKESVSIMELKFKNFDEIIRAKDSQLGLMSVERDSYKRTNDLLRIDVVNLTTTNDRLKNGRNNWRKLAIGSTTVVIGGSILIFLLK